MTDHAYPREVPLQEVKQDTMAEMPVRKPRHVRIARFVSYILAPSTISLPFVVLVAFYHTRDQLAAITYALITLFFLSIGPLIYVLIGVRLGKLSDVELS